MSEHTPTTEEVRDYIRAADRVTAHMFAPGTDSVEAFNRWLVAHDAEIRAGVIAEEPEGRRWFTAAYRAQNGNVIPIGAETVVQEHAQATVDEFTREDDEGPDYFLASRIDPPWVPVEQEGAE